MQLDHLLACPQKKNKMKNNRIRLFIKNSVELIKGKYTQFNLLVYLGDAMSYARGSNTAKHA